jgi:hypothetical protein
MLKLTYSEALTGCESALRDLLAEPNRAIFAIVEEFRDRVLRSRDIKDEWRAIYEDIRAEIWADRFAALAENAVHLRTWNEAVKHLTGALGVEVQAGMAAQDDKVGRARNTPAGRKVPATPPTNENTTAREASGFTVISISGTGGTPG